jgi:hypothetical protein
VATTRHAFSIGGLMVPRSHGTGIMPDVGAPMRAADLR